MNTSQHSKMKTVSVLMGIMMLAGIVWSGSAYAELKSTVYPGTMCQPYNPGAAKKIRYTTEGVYNSSTTHSVTVKCPVPSTIPGKLYSVLVDVKDQSDLATITCHVYIRKSNGLLVHSEVAHSDQIGSGNGNVVMNGISYEVNGQARLYNLSCSLPKKLPGTKAFTVIAYYVSEMSLAIDEPDS